MSDSNSNLSQEDIDTLAPEPGWQWGKRHTMVLLSFIGTAISCSIENNLSLAIVPMTQELVVPHIPENFQHQLPKLRNSSMIKPARICLREDDQNRHRTTKEEDLNFLTDVKMVNKFLHPTVIYFDWTEKEQGLILGSFFWGYTVTQYPGGCIAHKYGSKWVFSVGVMLSGIFALLLPIVTGQFGYVGLICIRVLQGIAQGVTCPAIQVMLAHWSPLDERSRMTNAVYTGYPFGTAATLVTGGYIIRSYGWPSMFLVVGSLSIFWFILWTLLVFNTPQEHPCISTRELHIIQESMKENSIRKNLSAPWCQILLSLPVWAILVIQVGQFWGKNIIQIEIPKYLGTVHGLQIQHIGWIAALPQFLNCGFGLLTSYLSDWLIVKRVASVAFTRKLCAIIVGFGTSAAFLGMAFGGCHSVIALSSLLIGGVVSGASRGSWMVNILDIAPNYVGTISALGNIASYFFGMLAPFATGLILHLYPTLLGWQIVFVIGAVINLSVSLFYLKFAEGTEQLWNINEDNTD